MSLNFKMKVLAGAIAMAIGGTAMANTSLDGAATGDVFLNIIDTTNNTSFLYDTGMSTAQFGNGTASFSTSVAADPNYTAFMTGAGSNALTYSVLSATNNGTTGTVNFTSTTTPAPIPGFNVVQAQASINAGFLLPANAVTSSTSNSVYLQLVNGNNWWGAAIAEGATTSNLAIGIGADSTSVGTALNYYSETSSALRSKTVLSTTSTFAGTWDLTANGTLSYNTSPVPLPTPLLLLLSGLGLMGVVARRGKSAGDFSSGAAAA
jgi:hypothetical protein